MTSSPNNIATAVTSSIEGALLAIVRFTREYLKLLWLVIIVPSRGGWVLLYQSEIQLSKCPALPTLALAIFAATSILLACMHPGATLFDVFDSVLAGLTQHFSTARALCITLPSFLVVYSFGYLISLFFFDESRKRIHRLFLYIVAAQISAFTIILVAILLLGMAGAGNALPLTQSEWTLVLGMMAFLSGAVAIWPQLAWGSALCDERLRIDTLMPTWAVFVLTLTAYGVVVQFPLKISHLRWHPAPPATTQLSTSPATSASTAPRP